MKSFNALASGNSATLKAIIETINEYVSNSLITNKIQDVDPQIIKHPIKNSDVVVVGNKQAEVSPDAIINFIAMQTTLIPIILFIVIILAATMIATAIATEKEDKTLETLLTVPVDRKYIVLAKMCGAGIMAFLSAGIYMLGFRNYLNGVVGEGMSSTMTPALKDAVIQLGLTIGAYEYFLLGLSLFLGIMVALAIAMIVGVFAEDVKGAQGLISPLMFLVMIPYMLTMLVDVNSVSSGLKWLIYAIPFSHSFLVAPNLFLRNYSLVYGGILYQAIIFVIFVFIAAKIFSSEKLFTIRLRFGRKNKTKNS
jgi:ABC-2 type transport system permease protein